MFFLEQKKTAGLHHTEDRAGDAPKPIQNGNAQNYFYEVHETQSSHDHPSLAAAFVDEKPSSLHHPSTNPPRATKKTNKLKMSIFHARAP